MRVLFAAEPGQEHLVRRRIASALASGQLAGPDAARAPASFAAVPMLALPVAAVAACARAARSLPVRRAADLPGRI